MSENDKIEIIVGRLLSNLRKEIKEVFPEKSEDEILEYILVIIQKAKKIKLKKIRPFH